jgi:dihydroorotate dehydrogenase electron transfer subunit
MSIAVQERNAEIFAVQKVGAYVQFTVVAPGIATDAQPGQFVAVSVGGENSPMLLRRAFALYGATPSGDFAGTIQFVVAEHGPGTRWLVNRRAGDRIDVVGPLGQPFPIPSGPAPAVLVGGGYGSAPLIPLAQTLLARGSTVEMVLGAATADRLFGELIAKRLIGAVTVTTDDGSAGQQGLVTDVLDDAVQRINAEIIYACGPMPMLRAVGDIARAHAIHAQVAVEEAMACGIGICMTCVMPVTGGDGRTRMVRSCVEGPVFRGTSVRWDAFEDGYCAVPDDAVGSPTGPGH